MVGENKALLFNTSYIKKTKTKAQMPPTLLKKRLWHWCFPVNFVTFLRAPFLQNTSGRLLLHFNISLRRDFPKMVRKTSAMNKKLHFR